jgi:hypothetical protein
MPKIIGIKERIYRTYNPEDDMDTPETTPKTTAPEAAEKRPPTIAEVETYFALQAQLIEAQLHDGGAYQNCPVCTHAKNSLKEIVKLLRASISNLNEATDTDRREGTISRLAVHERMLAELPWFELAKSITLAMAQSGHMPAKVMNQHPELVVTKHEKRAMKSGKHRRKLAREARRQNR